MMVSFPITVTHLHLLASSGVSGFGFIILLDLFWRAKTLTPLESTAPFSYLVGDTGVYNVTESTAVTQQPLHMVALAWRWTLISEMLKIWGKYILTIDGLNL